MQYIDKGKLSFFMGANTPNGFVSLFDGLYDPREKSRCYILKGGPGTGKSGTMKKIASHAEMLGYDVERIYCSSDPASLDAVIIPELNTVVADGTAPHVIEPSYPGACEIIVNSRALRDARALFENSEEIIGLTDECSRYHKKCVHFLASASLLERDCAKIYAPLIDYEKITRYVSRIAAREFTPTLNTEGVEIKRFLSAVTPEGVVAHQNSVETLCDKVYIFKDENGFISSAALDVIKDVALDAGLKLIVCRCPMSPYNKLEHIIIPELRLCFLTENSYHKFDINGSKSVNMKRFCDTETLSEFRQKINFNQKTRREMINEAVRYLQLAKATHDRLEEFYISAMNFELVSLKAQQLIDEIFE